MLAPIVLFVYNRPWHTNETLKSLALNNLASDSTLFIFSDGPRDKTDSLEVNRIEETRKIIRTKKWCKEVIINENDINLGLADSIVSGVTKVVNEFGKIIILEDDLVLSKEFLNYMNSALELYKNETSVMHISGYFPPILNNLPSTFFYNQTSCWGWATWERAWKVYNPDPIDLHHQIIMSKRIHEFNLEGAYPFIEHLEANINGSLKTWAIKWHASVFLKLGLCLHPNKSLIANIGFDGSGNNCGVESRINLQELLSKVILKNIPLKESRIARKLVRNYYILGITEQHNAFKSLVKQILNLKSVLRKKY